jgi:FlaA1/EpsC-like NDP-sugar epimerase
MNESKRRLLLLALKLFDLGLVLVSFAFAVVLTLYVHSGPSFAEFLSMRVKVGNIAIFVAAVLAWHMIFSLTGMYGSKRLATKWSMAVDVAKAITLCTLGLEVVNALFSIGMVTPRFLLIFWASSFLLVVFGRLILRTFLGSLRCDVASTKDNSRGQWQHRCWQ